MLACEVAAFELLAGAWGAQTAVVSVSLTFNPSAASGVSSTTRKSGTLSVPCNFPLYFQSLQSIPTVPTALTLGNVTPLGYALIHNTDLVNYVSIFSSASGTNEILRLYPGDVALVPLGPNATPYAQANTAAINLEMYVTAR